MIEASPEGARRGGAGSRAGRFVRGAIRYISPLRPSPQRAAVSKPATPEAPQLRSSPRHEQHRPWHGLSCHGLCSSSHGGRQKPVASGASSGAVPAAAAPLSVRGMATTVAADVIDTAIRQSSGDTESNSAFRQDATQDPPASGAKLQASGGTWACALFSSDGDQEDEDSTDSSDGLAEYQHPSCGESMAAASASAAGGSSVWRSVLSDDTTADERRSSRRLGPAATRTSRHQESTLSRLTMVSYSALRGAMSFSNMIAGTASQLYTEQWGMTVGLLSIVVTQARCLDFMVGFVVGFVSDNFKSSWGRRRPFIMVGGPVAALMLLLFVTPPRALHSSTAEHTHDPLVEDQHATLCAAAMNSSCEAVRSCVDAAVATGRLPHWRGGDDLVDGESIADGGSVLDGGSGATAASDTAVAAHYSPSAIWLAVWFAITYGLRFIGGQTVVSIPHEALGMELATTYTERTKLFAFTGAGPVTATWRVACGHRLLSFPRGQRCVCGSHGWCWTLFVFQPRAAFASARGCVTSLAAT